MTTSHCIFLTLIAAEALTDTTPPRVMMGRLPAGTRMKVL